MAEPFVQPGGGAGAPRDLRSASDTPSQAWPGGIPPHRLEGE
jgi:hypothetical protein